MQDTSNIDNPLQLNSIVLYRNCKTVNFADKLKSLRNAPSKMTNKHTEVKYELLERKGKFSTKKTFDSMVCERTFALSSH